MLFDKKYNDFKKCAGIYCILNIVTGKFYIGSTKNFRRRFTAHRASLRKQRHHSNHLQNSFNLYGENVFQFHVLKVVQFKNDKDLFQLEQNYLDASCPYMGNIGYNMNDNAFGPYLSPDYKEKARARHGKPVVAYFLDGTFFRTFSCSTEAEEELEGVLSSCIRKNCKGDALKAGNWMFRGIDVHGNYPDSLPPYKFPLRGAKRNPEIIDKWVKTKTDNPKKWSEDKKEKLKGRGARPVGVFDFLGYPVSIHDSIIDCAMHYGISDTQAYNRLSDGKPVKDLYLVYLQPKGFKQKSLLIAA